MSPLIDSSLLDSLGFLFTQTVTIQEQGSGRNSFGEDTGAWADKSDHVDIPCVVFPTGGREQKRGELAYATSTHKIQLQGAFTAVTPKMRAVSGARTFDILLVETDPMGVATKLICEIRQ